MLVTDAGLVKAGSAGRVLDMLKGREIEVFADVGPDPSIETVVICAERVRATNCQMIMASAVAARWMRRNTPP